MSLLLRQVAFIGRAIAVLLGASWYHGGLGELSGILHTIALLFSFTKVFLVIYLLILQSVSTCRSDHEQQS